MANSSLFLRADCGDGRYNDLHADWATDHTVTFPGVVPIIASRGDRLDQVVTVDVPLAPDFQSVRAISAPIGVIREVLFLGLASLAGLKQAQRLRVYTHQDCGFYRHVLGLNPSDDELKQELQLAVEDLREVLPRLDIRGHLVILDAEGKWSVEKPVVKVPALV